MGQEEPFPLEGGWLCLGFCNTVGWHGAEQYEERFTSYERLLDWCERKRVLEAATIERLRREAARRPDEADAVRRRAIALREAIYHVFAAVADETSPAANDLHALNEELAQANQHVRLAHGDDGFTWEWALQGDELDQMLWPVARSAAELLMSGTLSRVRECDNDPCGWLFVDMSRNRSRRWCDMRDCGNRVKARRHYQRVRATR